MAAASLDQRIFRFEAIDSTNDEARRRAEAGQTGPLWLIATRQTAGRGRRGRSWDSPVGNLHLTGLFTLETPSAQTALLSYAAAVSVAQAIEALGARRIRLKWPNDVWADDAKLAGVLLESGLGPAGRWLAVGIGVNIAFAPAIEGRHTVALADLTPGPPPEPHILARSIAAHFEDWLARFLAEGFADIRTAWLERAFGLGEIIEAQGATGLVRGRFQTLDATGALILQDDHGRRHSVTAGEVHFPETLRG